MAYRWEQTTPAQVFDIPLIGDDLANIGRVVELWANPCQPTAEIWVYALWQAIPTFFITLAKPELIDINIRHRRGKPRKGKKYRFNIHHLFRDALIEVPVPRWVVFRLYEFGQRIGWYFLVADATENLAINWISMAYMYNGCPVQDVPYWNYNCTDTLWGSGFGNTYQKWTWTGPNQSFDTSDFNNECVLTVPGRYTCNYKTTFRPYVNESVSELPYTVGLFINGTQMDVGEFSHGPDWKEASGAGVVIHEGGAPTFIKLAAAGLSASKFAFVSAQLELYRTNSLALSPDP